MQQVFLLKLLETHPQKINTHRTCWIGRRGAAAEPEGGISHYHMKTETKLVNVNIDWKGSN